MISLEVNSAEQAYIFFIFIINGFLIGFLFDLFRILRKSFKTSDFVTYIEDICFWILTGLLILYSIFKFNSGEIRFYILIAILIGVIVYMLTLSKFVIEIFVTILNSIKKVIMKITHIIFYPIKKLFFNPIHFIFVNVKKSIAKLIKKIEKTSFTTKKAKKQI
mgnify:CR=1 FL=1